MDIVRTPNIDRLVEHLLDLFAELPRSGMKSATCSGLADEAGSPKLMMFGTPEVPEKNDALEAACRRAKEHWDEERKGAFETKPKRQVRHQPFARNG